MCVNELFDLKKFDFLFNVKEPQQIILVSNASPLYSVSHDVAALAKRYYIPHLLFDPKPELHEQQFTTLLRIICGEEIPESSEMPGEISEIYSIKPTTDDAPGDYLLIRDLPRLSSKEFLARWRRDRAEFNPADTTGLNELIKTDKHERQLTIPTLQKICAEVNSWVQQHNSFFSHPNEAVQNLKRRATRELYIATEEERRPDEFNSVITPNKSLALTLDSIEKFLTVATGGKSHHCAGINEMLQLFKRVNRYKNTHREVSPIVVFTELQNIAREHLSSPLHNGYSRNINLLFNCLGREPWVNGFYEALPKVNILVSHSAKYHNSTTEDANYLSLYGFKRALDELIAEIESGQSEFVSLN